VSLPDEWNTFAVQSGEHQYRRWSGTKGEDETFLYQHSQQLIHTAVLWNHRGSLSITFTLFPHVSITPLLPKKKSTNRDIMCNV